MNRKLILSIDTALGNSSVAVTQGAHVLAYHQSSENMKHAKYLLPATDATLEAAQVKLREIDVFAASVGPGSFTGIRTGLATIKAFAATLNREVASVPTLHAIAIAESSNVKEDERVVAVLPAGRGEVFAQVLAFKAGGAELLLSELEPPMHISLDMLFHHLASSPSHVLWVGDGARARAEEITNYAAQMQQVDSVTRLAEQHESSSNVVSSSANLEWRVAPRPTQPLAVAVAQLASLAVENNSLLQADVVRALYVRLSDAELKSNVSAATNP